MLRMAPFLLLIVAVGGAPALDAAAGPCGVLTKAEVEEAAGAAVSEGAVNSANKLVCDYKAGSAGVINLMLTGKGPGDSPEKIAAELNRRKIKASVVPGIGEGAYASTHAYGMQQMGAFKGTNHVVVTVLLFGAPEAKAKAAVEKLARKAVSKL